MYEVDLEAGYLQKQHLCMSNFYSKVFVGGLHWTTTNEGLKAYFEQFGHVADCNIMRDPTGKSRCFGFVTFSDSAVVDVILQKTHILDKKQIDPKRAIPKEQQQQQQRRLQPNEDNKIFVGGIHIGADEEELKQYFGQFDDVLETILMRDRETGRSRGFGFVTFASHEGVEKASAAGNLSIRGKMVILVIEVKLAVPKGKPVPATMKQAGGALTNENYTAAIAEYYKNIYSSPAAYYEAMMKAYGSSYSPAALAAAAAYYSQFYGAAQVSEDGALGVAGGFPDQHQHQQQSFDALQPAPDLHPGESVPEEGPPRHKRSFGEKGSRRDYSPYREDTASSRRDPRRRERSPDGRTDGRKSARDHESYEDRSHHRSYSRRYE